MHQVGTKADFDFGFSMRFADQAAYDGYNSDPVHVAFVQERWLPEVEAFVELDYVSLERRRLMPSPPVAIRI